MQLGQSGHFENIYLEAEQASLEFYRRSVAGRKAARTRRRNLARRRKLRRFKR